MRYGEAGQSHLLPFLGAAALFAALTITAHSAGAGGGHRRACPGGADGALPEPKGRLRRGTGGRICGRSRP